MERDSNGQVQVSDDVVVNLRDTGVVDADVVGGPSDAGVFAARGQFTDEIRQVAVVGVASGLTPSRATVSWRQIGGDVGLASGVGAGQRPPGRPLQIHCPWPGGGDTLSGFTGSSAALS